MVGLGVFQIDFLMCDVEVATEHYRFFLVQFHKVGAEIVLPALAVGKAAQAVLRIGRIAADEIKIVKLTGDDAPLMVVLVDANAKGMPEHRHAREHGRAGIALLFGGINQRLVARQIYRIVLRAHFDFLQANHIGVKRRHALLKTLFDAGAQAVYVPGYQLHLFPSHAVLL